MFLCVIIQISCSNSENGFKKLESVYIYGSYHKIKTGVPLFGPLRIYIDLVTLNNASDYRANGRTNGPLV